MNAALAREFRDFLDLYLGDKRGIPYPVANMSAQTFNLDNIGTLERFDFSGDFIYADRNGAGVIDVRFNNPSMPPFPFAQNTAIKGFPFKEVYLTWDAQPGLTLTLWYGYGADIVPPNQDITQILAPVRVQDVGLQAGVNFTGSAAMTAGTPLNVVSVGSNVSGIRHHQSIFYSVNATNLSQISLVAKATPPASAFDGQIIAHSMAPFNSPPAFFFWGFNYKTVIIAAGKRLDFVTGITDTAGPLQSVSYDLI